MAKLCKLEDLPADSVRLPTEAEWEYACRVGTQSRFYTGDSENNLGYAEWFVGNSQQTTHPVGQKTPNAWGLYDMHGNVWEWCQDWYGPYNTDNAVDPRGAVSGSYRVIRGGSCYGGARNCRSAYRNTRDPDNANINLGFRMVLPAGQ
jgi:formylglycine-generating enzyme required for sulfatase activity